MGTFLGVESMAGFKWLKRFWDEQANGSVALSAGRPLERHPGAFPSGRETGFTEAERTEFEKLKQERFARLAELQFLRQAAYKRGPRFGKDLSSLLMDLDAEIRSTAEITLRTRDGLKKFVLPY